MKKFNYDLVLAAVITLFANVALASGCDVLKGETTFAVCKTCHTSSKDDRSFVGPNLFAVVGRDIAAKNDFFYSPALSEKKGVWDDQNLNDFLANPAKAIPGTMMAFGGIKDENQRQNLICFLKNLK
ncbi:cytochrome c family protein [Neptunomonas sp.]|uniref:c-type cytochrome n=1 Tax=Neptunomonas sp. TaxID=1971898 RepID=UPI003563F6F9